MSLFLFSRIACVSVSLFVFCKKCIKVLACHHQHSRSCSCLIFFSIPACGWFNERNEFHSIPTEIFEMTQLKYLIMCESFVAFLFAADCHEDYCCSLTQLWTTHTLLTIVYCVYSFRLLVCCCIQGKITLPKFLPRLDS